MFGCVQTPFFPVHGSGVSLPSGRYLWITWWLLLIYASCYPQMLGAVFIASDPESEKRRRAISIKTNKINKLMEFMSRHAAQLPGLLAVRFAVVAHLPRHKSRMCKTGTDSLCIRGASAFGTLAANVRSCHFSWLAGALASGCRLGCTFGSGLFSR